MVMTPMVGEDFAQRAPTGFGTRFAMNRDAIGSWAHHLNLRVLEILNGDEPNIPISSR
jgi:hypothetical protein